MNLNFELRCLGHETEQGSDGGSEKKKTKEMRPETKKKCLVPGGAVDNVE